MRHRIEIERARVALQSEAKARQASKLAEIREALVAAGYDTAVKQATALGVSRSTAWVLLNRDKRAGPSAMVIKRILSSPSLPPAVRRKVEEYVEERLAGLYGHSQDRRYWFRNRFASRSGIAQSASCVIFSIAYERPLVLEDFSHLLF